MNDWQQRYSDYLKQLTQPGQLTFLNELREALLEQPQRWYEVVYACQRLQPNSALLAAMLVLRIALAKRLHGDIQVVLMHTCVCAEATPNSSSGNALSDHLLGALNANKAQHEYVAMIRHSLHVAQALCAPKARSEAAAWRTWLQQPHGEAAWSWLQQLADCHHQALGQGAGDYLIPTRENQWLGRPEANPSKHPEVYQRQTEFMEPVVEAYKRNLKLQAPTKLLAALRNYAKGEGHIQPLVRAIHPHRALTGAIVDAAAAQNHQLARHQSDQRLRQAMIWLGPNRVANIIAKVLLQSQLTNYQSPQQSIILAHITLLQSVLPKLIRHSQEPVALKLPHQLFAFLWTSGLLANKSLRLAANMNQHGPIEHWHCRHWFLCDAPESWFQQFSLQVAKRWQLDTTDISAVNTEHANHAISALMICASAAVLRVYQPHRAFTAHAKKKLLTSLKALNINTKSWNSILTSAAQNEAAQLAWPPL